MTIRDLLRNALRMRPDRIVIGEVRGAEALDLLTALNTGHDGALSTVHANSPADALRRLETLALMAGVGLPHEAIARAGRARDRPRRPPRARRRRRPPRGRGRRGDPAAGASASASCGAASELMAPVRSRSVVLGGAAGGARALASARRCSRRPALAALARRRARAAAARRARGLRAERRSSAAGSPRSARAALFAAALLLAGPGPGAAARGRRAGRRRLGAGDAGAARYRRGGRARRCRRSPPRSPTRSPAGRSLRGSLRRGRRLARRAAGGRDGTARAPSSNWARRPARRSARCAGGCARRGSTPSPPRCSASSSPAATSPALLRRFAEAPRRARPGRRGRPRGDRAGALHRPAGRRDAERRGAVRRAAPARLPRPAPRRPGGGDPARARGRPAAGRLRRDPPARQGRRPMSARPACSPASPCCWRRCAVWELAGSRGEELGELGGARSAPPAAPRALARRGGASARDPGAARSRRPRRPGRGRRGARRQARRRRDRRACRLRSPRPPAPGRLSLVAAVALPAAGFLAPRRALEREARRRTSGLVAALPDALDLLAVGAAAGRSPAAVLGEIAAADAGPLATELAVDRRRARVRRVAVRGPGRVCASAFPAARWRRCRRDRALAPLRLAARRPAAPPGRRPAPRAAAPVEEHAARAAPKIQLVVALVLVPSVLLMIAAGPDRQRGPPAQRLLASTA